MEGFYYNRDTVFFDNPVTSLRIPVTWMITRKPTWNIISCHFSTIKVREVQLSLLRFKVNDKFSWRQILFVSLCLLLAKGLSKIKQQNQNIVTDEKVNIDQICKEMAFLHTANCAFAKMQNREKYCNWPSYCLSFLFRDFFALKKRHNNIWAFTLTSHLWHYDKYVDK